MSITILELTSIGTPVLKSIESPSITLIVAHFAPILRLALSDFNTISALLAMAELSCIIGIRDTIVAISMVPVVKEGSNIARATSYWQTKTIAQTMLIFTLVGEARSKILKYAESVEISVEKLAFVIHPSLQSKLAFSSLFFKAWDIAGKIVSIMSDITPFTNNMTILPVAIFDHHCNYIVVSEYFELSATAMHLSIFHLTFIHGLCDITTLITLIFRLIPFKWFKSRPNNIRFAVNQFLFWIPCMVTICNFDFTGA